MKKNGLFKNGIFYAIVFLGIIGIVSWAGNGASSGQSSEISASKFVKQLKEDEVKEFSIQPSGCLL